MKRTGMQERGDWDMRNRSSSGRIVLSIAAGAASILTLVSLAQPGAAEEVVNTGYFGDVAIKGYDPVAYFTQNAAVEGSERVLVQLAGRDLALRQRREPRPVRRRPGQVRAAVRRSVRRRRLLRHRHHQHRSEGLADHRGQALPGLRPRRRGWLGEERDQGGQLPEVLAGSQRASGCRETGAGLEVGCRAFRPA